MPIRLENDALHIAAATFPFAIDVNAIEDCTVDGRQHKNITPAHRSGVNTSASFSNLIGIVVTPALVTAFLVTQTGGGVSLVAVRDIALQLLAPFVAGQLSRKWIGRFVARHKQMLGYVDRGSILLVVYAAFSEGVVAGIWSRLSIPSLLSLFLANAAILAAVLGSSMWVARRLRFSTEDQIAIVFCGSKKSLASPKLRRHSGVI